jgi:transcriptional regulator with XRE-family HTH domain
VTYGARLRELRAERQLSLREVEVRGGPNKDTMSLIERGVHKPQPQTLGRIAKALGMGVAELRYELEAAEHPLASAPPSQEKLFNNGILEEERRSKASPTAAEITAIKRWLSYLEQRLTDGNLSREEIAHDLDAARALGIGKDPALYPTDLVGDFLQIGRRALEEGKSFDTLQTELAGLEADMDQLEEVYAETKEQQT